MDNIKLLNNINNLTIGNKSYKSRLIIGSGKYKNSIEIKNAAKASGAEIITVAISKVNISKKNKNFSNLLETIQALHYTILPNTAGSYNAKDAIYTAQLAQEILNGNKLIKLEILGNTNTLLPNMPETLKATEMLVKNDFDVMVYCNDDPVQTEILEQMGAKAIMPLASLIGSGMGILNPWNLSLIIKQSKVPVLVDAGIGTASDATIAMELGCDGILVNTAIACAKYPIKMAKAMKLAVQAGREAFLAGRINKKFVASPSSQIK